MSRKEKKYHYLYKITNTKNNRYYIGMHSTSNLEDGYMGGGTRIRNSIRYHGKEVHQKEILEFFDNRVSLANAEKQMVNEHLISDEMCMNLAIGGIGGSGCFTQEQLSAGAKVTNEKIWKDPLYREKISKVAAKTMNKLWSDPDKSKHLLESAAKAFKDKTHTIESKKKMGEAKLKSGSQKGNKNSQAGKSWVYNEELQNNKSIKKEELDSHLSKGWTKGRKMKF